MSQHRLCNNFGSAKFAGPANIFCASHLKSNLVMLFSLQMQPTLSHVPQRLLARSFGQTARPKASPKCLEDSRLRPAFVTQMLEGFERRPTWLSTGSGPRPECFPPRTGTSNIFSPEYTGGIQKHGALLPHSWIQEAPLKGLEGGDFGIYIGQTLLRQMDAKRPRHGTHPPNK